MNDKLFNSKPLNQIIIINIIIYLIGFVLTKLLDLRDFFVYYLSLNSNIGFDIHLPYLFLTHGFVHADFYHIMGNMLFFFLYYPLFSKIETTKIWRIYLSSIILGGLTWLVYLYFFDYKLSVLLGASGGIMALISYGCNKFEDEYVINYDFFKIKFIHLLYIHITLSVLNFLSHNNEGGEIAHLTGIVVGWYLSKSNEFTKENKD